jgi:hypothetical protein
MPELFRTTRFQAAFLILLFAALSFISNAKPPAPDFYAMWMAGRAWAAGDIGSIYPLNTGAFDLLAPQSWYDHARDIGYQDALFPFIYPPLWAVLAAPLTKITSFAVVNAIAAALNPIMMSLCVVLAGRIVGLKQINVMMLLTGQVILFSTWIGQVAILQNQPQVFVAVLTLLSIERARAGKPITAGAALALAASVKLYPALFIIFFLAGGHRRVALPFVITGAALGGASVVLAGWPLHEVFLAQVSTIAQTVLVSPVNFSFDPVIGQLFFDAQLPNQPIPDWARLGGPDETDYLGYIFMTKPALWSLINSVVMTAVLAGGAFAMYSARRTPQANLNSSWIWPAAMGGYALFSPLSWSCHYIAVVAFAPYITLWLGNRLGLFLLAVIFLPVVVPAFLLFDTLSFVASPFQVFGTLSVTAYVCVLIFMTRRGDLPVLRAESAAQAEQTNLG